MPPITAVLFDFDHTLGIDNKLEEFALREVAQSYCGSRPSDGEVRAVLRRYRTGEQPVDVAIADGLQSWGCERRNAMNGARAFRERCLALAPERVLAMPGAHEMLRELVARDIPLGILSNGWTQLQHLKGRLIGFPGPVLASDEIGAWKPDVRAFAIALERLAMSAATTLYVGDDPVVDIAGAKAAGMLAAWADLEGKPYPNDERPPDFTVTALGEVAMIAAMS